MQNAGMVTIDELMVAHLSAYLGFIYQTTIILTGRRQL
jgi:hypothetical protein